MNRDWCIPLPPDATASAAKGETKRAVGLYPCINAGHCSEFILIKLDRKGFPYGTCSPGEINIRGCKVRSVKGAREDIPEQTYDAYQDALKRVSDLTTVPDTYLKYLEQAWAHQKEQGGEHESISA